MDKKRNLFTAQRVQATRALFALILFPLLAALFLTWPLHHLLQQIGWHFSQHTVADRLLILTALGVIIYYRARLDFRTIWTVDLWTAAEIALGGFLALLTVQAVFALDLLSGFFQLSVSPLDFWTLGKILLATLLVPFLEETLFRGFIFVQAQRLASTPGAVLLSSVLYAWAHFPIGTSPLSLSGLNLFLLGVILAVLFIQSGRLWIAYSFHAGAILGLFLLPHLLQPLGPYAAGNGAWLSPDPTKNIWTTLALILLLCWLWIFRSRPTSNQLDPL